MALTRPAKSCGPDASTLASSRRENFPPVTVTKKPDRRGELEVSRKPLRREGRTASAEPVCSCAFLFAHLARETAGAARTRSSLRPLIFRRRDLSKPRAHRAAGTLARIPSHYSTARSPRGHAGFPRPLAAVIWAAKIPFGNRVLTMIGVWLGAYKDALLALVLTRWGKMQAPA